jgi:3-deoxy-D-manno-octulosonic-acid transferase
MLRLYNTVLLSLRPLVEAWALCARLRPAARSAWSERRAVRPPAARAGAVWIHGASVGEARIVHSLVGALRAASPELPLVVSAHSATGRDRLPVPPQVDEARFAPLDFAPYVRRWLTALRPAAVVLVETELWPNLLHRAQLQAVPVVVVNARLSPRRMGSYRRLAGLFGPLLAHLAAVGARSVEDAARFVELGARPAAVAVTGDIKYDLPAPEGDGAALRGRWGLGQDRPVLLAGSTARGEDGVLLEAFASLRSRHPDLALVLAPRHLDRVEEVAALLRRGGFAFGRHSADRSRGRIDVILVDTLGELPVLYRAASVAFVGGSLVPVGGHNVLEPAAVGVPVLFGPHVDQVLEAATALETAGGGRRVRDARDLAREVERWLVDEPLRAESGRRARDVVERHRGALQASVSLLLGALDGARRGEGGA